MTARTGQPWTAKEADWLAGPGRRLTAAQAGEVLGRTAKAVSEARGRFGVSVLGPRLGDSPRIRRYVAALNADGLTDSEIAARLDRRRRTVTLLRTRMGLASNRTGPGYRRRRARLTRRQCRANGVEHLVELREMHRRAERAKHGGQTSG